MGNCTSVRCRQQSKQVYRVTLDEIFSRHYGVRYLLTSTICTFVFSLVYPLTTPPLAQFKTMDLNQPDNAIDVPKLQANVRTQMKTLVDHLESDQSKLAETGKYLEKIITTTINPETHLTGIFVLTELMDALQGISKEKSEVMSPSKTKKVKTNFNLARENRRMADSMEREQTESPIMNQQVLTEAFLQFETSFKEIILFLLDEDANPFSKIFFVIRWNGLPLPRSMRASIYFAND